MNSNSALETSFERLSSGQRINSAVDDAAGLSIGKDLQSRVSGLNQAIRNTNDAISMAQIAEGAMDEATTILQRMRDLAVQSASDSLTATERGYLDTEQSKLATALDKALAQAKFNGTSLITGSDQTKTIQTGADDGDTTTLSLDGINSDTLNVTDSDVNFVGKETATFDTFADANQATGDKFTLTTDAIAGSSKTYITAAAGSGGFADNAAIAAALQTAVSAGSGGGTGAASALITVGTNNFGDITITYASGGAVTNAAFGLTKSTGTAGTDDTAAVIIDGGTGAAAASAALSKIDTAMDTVATKRAALGATQVQLESTVRNLANVAENTAAAAGRIMDTDYAAETANLTKAQILQQAATSILAQANAQPQAVLSLLQ
jgi:flagellin